jgi:ribosomal protein S12 methylthiotransferase RimO
MRVAMVTLGCARNEVDSDELAGRLAAEGWSLTADADDADVVVVNTCGFVEEAKKDSIDALLAAADLRDEARPRAVVAVGCMAERYGAELAAALPEADAVLGFDDYPRIAERLRAIVAGERPPAHAPRDRRALLPIAPVERPAAPTPEIPRYRLSTTPTAPLKLASGCDRRCSFCAIPFFRGAFISRSPGDLLREAADLGASGVREIFCVSENTTAYGKDLGEPDLLTVLLPQLAATPGVARVRLSYLQPAEVRPGLLEAIAGTAGVADYFDLSFQHAAAGLLRRMRRFGSGDSFLDLIDRIRSLSPQAGIRSNVIVGFPGESEEEFAELEQFLTAARLDVVGVFGFSAEDGTEAATLPGQLPAELIAERVERLSRLVEELMDQRAEDRIGEVVDVLVEEVDADGRLIGRSDQQGPESDGITVVTGPSGPGPGDLIRARVTGHDGVDLVAEPITAPGAQR